MNIVQSYWLDENTKYLYPEVESDPRDEVRSQIDVLMYRRTDASSTRDPAPVKYLEPNEEGYYPGLERAGRLDA